MNRRGGSRGAGDMVRIVRAKESAHGYLPMNSILLVQQLGIQESRNPSWGRRKRQGCAFSSRSLLRGEQPVPAGEGPKPQKNGGRRAAPLKLDRQSDWHGALDQTRFTPIIELKRCGGTAIAAMLWVPSRPAAQPKRVAGGGGRAAGGSPRGPSGPSGREAGRLARLGGWEGWAGEAGSWEGPRSRGMRPRSTFVCVAAATAAAAAGKRNRHPWRKTTGSSQ